MRRVPNSAALLPLRGDHRKMRFLVVGAWNTVFAYIAYGIVYVLLHNRLHYLIISVLAHMLAVTNAFVCQRKLVFRSSAPWWPAFLRFNLVQLLMLAGSLCSMVLMVEWLHIKPLPSQVAIISVVLIISYIMHRDFSFRP